MSVTLTISEKLYERARQLAQERQQPVEEVIAGLLDEALPPVESGPISSDAANAVVEREMAAYVALHPQLKKKYLGQHVAIHDGRLVDHDEDFDALYERIERRYPGQFVWLTTVEEEPIRTIIYRSPRLMRDS